ncbi:MAG: zinc-dependent metalloprotease family protein, partial [Candidatus Hodarchaeota archaeon]
MKRQLISLMVCLFLFTGLFSFSTNSVKSVGGDGIVIVDLKVRGTFLRAMDDWPYYGPGDYAYDENLELNVGTYTDFRVEEPTIIDLQAEGFNEGDTIYISWLGGYYLDGANNPSLAWASIRGLRENNNLPWGGLLGLFSATSQLDPDLNNLNRVPGAINYGSNDIVTPETWWQDGRPELAQKLAAKNIDWYTGSMETDIPEDFMVHPHEGMKVKIPRNARFLFLSIVDPYYRDNYEGPNGLVVTIEKDTDEDGIPDNWEKNGIDIDHDGVIDLDLPMLDANWEHKDVFVEVDYMGSFGGHTHRPDPTAISDVIEAFANSPVSNPDNIDGINLHVFIDEELAHQNEKSFNEVRTEKRSTFGTAQERYRPETIAAKELVFHYCVFIHQQKGGAWSGIGEVQGNDFLVSLGAFSNNAGTIQDQAATFMHELGHNLGLRHGGDTDEPNYKSNYVSIMNYLFQFDRRVPSRALDFSIGNKPTIREYAIDENVGIGDLVKTA